MCSITKFTVNYILLLLLLIAFVCTSSMDTCPYNYMIPTNGMFNVTGNGIASDHDSTSGVPKTMFCPYS